MLKKSCIVPILKSHKSAKIKVNFSVLLYCPVLVTRVFLPADRGVPGTQGAGAPLPQALLHPDGLAQCPGARVAPTGVVDESENYLLQGASANPDPNFNEVTVS